MWNWLCSLFRKKPIARQAISIETYKEISAMTDYSRVRPSNNRDEQASLRYRDVATRPEPANNTTDDGFAASVALGYALNDGLAGGLLGGNLMGGVLGDSLNTSEVVSPSYDSSTYDSSPSYDSNPSYDSGSSFDGGSDFGGGSDF